MTYTIKKGRHRSGLKIGLYWNKKCIAYKVMFDNSCKYHINGEDQQDINKLFGVGYLPTHHKDSARFGWRYNEDVNKVELFAYCYVNGKRQIKQIVTIPLNRWFDAEIKVYSDHYFFTITYNGIQYRDIIKKTHSKKIGYRLNPFFGGNNPAPKTINIEIKRI